MGAAGLGGARCPLRPPWRGRRQTLEASTGARRPASSAAGSQGPVGGWRWLAARASAPHRVASSPGLQECNLTWRQASLKVRYPRQQAGHPSGVFFVFFLTTELQNSRTVVFATCCWVQSSAFLDVGEDSVSTCKLQSKGYRVHFVRLATRPPAQGQGPFKQKSLSPTEMEINLKSVSGTG